MGKISKIMLVTTEKCPKCTPVRWWFGEILTKQGVSYETKLFGALSRRLQRELLKSSLTITQVPVLLVFRPGEPIQLVPERDIIEWAEHKLGCGTTFRKAEEL